MDTQARKPGGPPREEPTKEERDRVPELKALAHQALMLGARNDLLVEAAAIIQQAQSKIDAAMALRQERKVDPGRPGRQPADEIVALENLEQSAIAFVRKKLTVTGSIDPGVDEWLRAWAADSVLCALPDSPGSGELVLPHLKHLNVFVVDAERAASRKASQRARNLAGMCKGGRRVADHDFQLGPSGAADRDLCVLERLERTLG